MTRCKGYRAKAFRPTHETLPTLPVRQAVAVAPKVPTHVGLAAFLAVAMAKLSVR